MTRLPETLNAPLPEGETLSRGTDFYKPTMSQYHYEQHPDAVVTFTFKNRADQDLTEYVDPEALSDRLEALRQRHWTTDELDFLAEQRRNDGDTLFTPDFIDYLAANQLPPVTVRRDEDLNDLAIQTVGEAPLVTFWETIVMSEVNEMYFENYLVAHDINPEDVYEEGDRRLSEKIAILQAHPDILFSDFGTRRHFSLRWHKHVVERLLAECPDNFVGTSNVALARTLDVKPIGTFAHEMPMIEAGIAEATGTDIRQSHGKFLNGWNELYGDNLDIALTDTFTSEFFFSDFTQEQAEEWGRLRHDSADPFEFGERAIAFYEERGIDPLEKTIVFSDGLDIETIVQLQQHFKGRINTVYGWGTTLTNDLGIKPLNIVMKATHVHVPDIGRGADLVKLSDVAGKHTGPKQNIQRYQQIFAPVVKASVQV